ncbi:hypothetical protein ACI2KR_29335 [Pseudomonas luteola]
MKNQTSLSEQGHVSRPKRHVAVRTLGWVSGVTPTVAVFREAKTSAIIIWWMINNLVSLVRFNRTEAKADNTLAKTSPEQFWDECVRTAAITESSVRARYKMAYWLSVVLFFAFSASIAMVIMHMGDAWALTRNLFLLNILFIIHVTNLHRLYTAREQRIITILAFVRLMIMRPALFVPETLPKNYKLRKEQTEGASK